MKLLKYAALLICSLFVENRAQAQGAVYRPDTTWKVFNEANQEKTLGFSGGFNNPQIGTGDINNDGKADLIVFEKGSLQIKTFLNTGTSGAPAYRYRPEFERNFPQKNGITTISSYLKVEDFNCDNIPDLLTRGLGGFSVYYGYYVQNQIHFNYIKDLYYTPLRKTDETFDATTFPPVFWKVKNPAGPGWSRISSGTNPTATPKAGAAMVMFQASAMTSGSTALLISKQIRVSPNLKSEGKISFWVYRSGTSGSDSLAVYINNDTTLTNATWLGGVARNRSLNRPDTKPSDGWYQYTFDIPFQVTGNKLYFIFKGTGYGGANLYLDEVSWISSEPTGDINAYVDPGGDIPGVADVDHDGDLDFFSLNISGGLVNFYKNYQAEEGLPCDSIHINLKDACWGKVYQGSTPTQQLGITCNLAQPPIFPAKVTHTGNTMCVFDYDGDGDMDYLNGGVSYSNIQLLINGKADFNYIRDSMISQDIAWKAGGYAYNTLQFPAAFYVDYDQDGKKDILIAPSAEVASENYSCISYYRNTGTASVPDFTFQSDTLLVDQTIDLGTGSYPMIFDYNRDGKPDLFVGADGYFQNDGSFKAGIAYYENIGTGGNRAFKLVTLDFLNILSQATMGTYPAVGDLDNDGLEDLVVGHSDGTLSFYKNMAASASVMPQWQLTTAILKDASSVTIDSAKFAAPFIYDIDKDGYKDLLIGGLNGKVFFYKNAGLSNAVTLLYQTNKLGDMQADPWNNFSANAVPYVGKTDSTGTEYFVLGSNSGRIQRYTGFQNGNVTSPYQKIDTAYHQINFSLGLYSGFRATPTFGDLDGDGRYEMILGNRLGGVTVFGQVSSLGVDDPAYAPGNVKVHPNPAVNEIFVTWTSDFSHQQDVSISLRTISGQTVSSYLFTSGDLGARLETSGLAPGVYLCDVISGRNRSVQKVVILK